MARRDKSPKGKYQKSLPTRGTGARTQAKMDARVRNGGCNKPRTK